jgi:hypothetical protein
MNTSNLNDKLEDAASIPIPSGTTITITPTLGQNGRYTLGYNPKEDPSGRFEFPAGAVSNPYNVIFSLSQESITSGFTIGCEVTDMPSGVSQTITYMPAAYTNSISFAFSFPVVTGNASVQATIRFFLYLNGVRVSVTNPDPQIGNNGTSDGQ